MPIINGITRDEGSYLLPPDSLEPVLKAGGNLSFGSTALGVELQEVSTVERLITSHYLGRWVLGLLLHIKIWRQYSGSGLVPWKTTKLLWMSCTRTLYSPVPPTR